MIYPKFINVSSTSVSRRISLPPAAFPSRTATKFDQYLPEVLHQPSWHAIFGTILQIFIRSSSCFIHFIYDVIELNTQFIVLGFFSILIFVPPSNESSFLCFARTLLWFLFIIYTEHVASFRFRCVISSIRWLELVMKWIYRIPSKSNCVLVLRMSYNMWTGE